MRASELAGREVWVAEGGVSVVEMSEAERDAIVAVLSDGRCWSCGHWEKHPEGAYPGPCASGSCSSLSPSRPTTMEDFGCARYQEAATDGPGGAASAERDVSPRGAADTTPSGPPPSADPHISPCLKCGKGLMDCDCPDGGEFVKSEPDRPDKPDPKSYDGRQANMTRAQRIEDDLRLLYGLPPYNTWSNHCYGDGYFAGGMKRKYGKEPEELAREIGLDTKGGGPNSG